jgi:glyoxylase-like metal-dependent hydrolase (beta-lactamase superfamily II)
LKNLPRVRNYSDGDKVSVGGLEFEVITTPGHTPGGVCLKCEDALFTGDTLFKDSCGRTDMDGGSMEILLKSLKRLSELPGDYEVYPGHSDFTTLEHERKLNYYMKYAVDRA